MTMFKKFSKINLIPRLFLSLLIMAIFLQVAGLFFLIGAPNIAQASDPIKMNLQVPIPTFSGGETKIQIKFDGTTRPIADYIVSVYNYAVGIVGILAAVVMMIGGLMWITAGGNTSNIGEAKAMITASLTGLVLVLTSYLILSNVNPALVNLESSVIKGVKPEETAQTATSNQFTVKDCAWKIKGKSENLNTGYIPADYETDCKETKPAAAGDWGCFCSYVKKAECYWKGVSACEAGETIYAMSTSQPEKMLAVKNCGSTDMNYVCCCSAPKIAGCAADCTKIKTLGFNIQPGACASGGLSSENCQASKQLLDQLSGFKKSFEISGATPRGGDTGCHGKGTCVDVVPVDGCKIECLAKKLSAAKKSGGIAFIQYESSNCVKKTTNPNDAGTKVTINKVLMDLSEIPCVSNPDSSGEHFHVQLYTAK